MGLLWLIACDLTRYANLPPATTPLDAPGGTADTGEPGVTIRGWDLLCLDDTQWELVVRSSGPTSGTASVFMVRTQGALRGEQHEVAAVQPGSGLHRAVLTDEAAAWESGVSTGFACGVDSSYDVMTWVLRIDTPEEVLADCVVLGHDPEGVLDGSYAIEGLIDAPGELGACRAVRL